MAGKYLDFSKDAFDNEGIQYTEIEQMLNQGWILISTQEEVEASVKFMDRKTKRGEYTETGIMPQNTNVLINPEENLAMVTKCRNDINSDWRTLMKLQQFQ